MQKSTPTKDTNMGILKSGPLLHLQGQQILKTTSRHKGRTDNYKPRKMVLTSKALHLFKKQAESDLFGTPRGVIPLENIMDVVCVSGQQGFAVTTDSYERYIFEAENASEASEWVDAIRSAKSKEEDSDTDTSTGIKRRNTLSGVDFRGALGPQISGIVMASSPPMTSGIYECRHKHQGSQVLIRRDTIWGKNVPLPMPRIGEEIRVSMRDGGVAALTREDLLEALKCINEKDMDEESVVDRRVPIAYKTDSKVVTELQFEVRKAALNKKWVEPPQAAGVLASPPSSPTLSSVNASRGFQRADTKSEACQQSGSKWSQWWFKWKWSQSRVFTCTVSILLSLYLPFVFPPIQEMNETRDQVCHLDSSLSSYSTCAASSITSLKFWFTNYDEPMAFFGVVLSLITMVSLMVRVLLYGLELYQLKKAVGGGMDSEWVLELRFIDIVFDEASDMPLKFLQGCMNNRAEAARRWKVTKRWREAERIDHMLEECPQAYFDFIKKWYPHYWIGRAKCGSVIYIEKTGETKPKMLAEGGVTVDILVNYYLFLTEYQWNILNTETDGPRSKCISVFDVKGVSLSDIPGAWGFLSASMKLIGDHYPERAQNILIVNAPAMFSTVWSLVLPLVNEATRAKIRLAKASDVKACFAEFADPESIPVEYGGTWDGSNNVMEEDFKKFVYALNEKHGLAPPYDKPRKA